MGTLLFLERKKERERGRQAGRERGETDTMRWTERKKKGKFNTEGNKISF